MRGLRKRSLRRAGLSREQHAELKALHRRVTMLMMLERRRVTHGDRVLAVIEVPNLRGSGSHYEGVCEKCNQRRQLYVCHIMPQGKYPHMKYDSDNAWAGCYACHIHWWHKNPIEAKAWITERIGAAKIEVLRVRSQYKKPLDYHLLRLQLLGLIVRLSKSGLSRSPKAGPESSSI